MSRNYLFEKKDIKNAALHQRIVIKDTRPPKEGDIRTDIIGILQEPIQYQVEGNWDNIFNISDRFDLARKALSFADLGLLNAGIATRRYYKGGGYLRINPKFRVVDTEGTGIVISMARALMNMALPSMDKELNEDTLRTMFNENKTAIVGGAAGAVLDGGRGAIVGAAAGKAVDSISKKGLKDAAKDAVNAITDPVTTVSEFISYVKSNGILTNSPAPVYVEIGDYFWQEFVIENVNAEISREMTVSGPLYADFEVTLSTLEVVTRNNLGFLSSFRGGKRVEVRP